MQDKDKRFILCSFLMCVIIGSLVYTFKSIERIRYDSVQDQVLSEPEQVKSKDMDFVYSYLFDNCGITRAMGANVALLKIPHCISQIENNSNKEEVERIIQSMIEAKGVEIHRDNKVYVFGIVKVADETDPKFLNTNIK